MFEERDDVLDQLRVGEDATAEFKEVRLGDNSVVSPNTEGMAGECVAFTNAEGGAIFLGVDDEGVVRGLPEDRFGDIERWIINVTANNCEPPIRPVIRRELLPKPDGSDGLVGIVEIRRGLFVHRTSGGRYFVRVGSSKRDLTPAELGRLFQDRGRAFVFDEQPVPDATGEALDDESLKAFFGERPGIPWGELLANTRVLVNTDEGTSRVSVAGLLSFGRNPQEYLTSAFIEAAAYRSDQLSSDDLVHAARMVGRADLQIDEATAFVERLMLKPARKPAGREDFPQYDLGAVHEAIVNAVAHRDYSLGGAKIRLFLFSDRLELYSPGALPNTLTLETMPFRVFTRNQLLVSFLSRMKSGRTGRAFLESRGEGVRRILESSERHSGRRPEYSLFDQELRLTIWAKPSPHEDD
jgi:predicted HTH transcriptional regulator